MILSNVTKKKKKTLISSKFQRTWDMEITQSDFRGQIILMRYNILISSKFQRLAHQCMQLATTQ